MNYPTIIEVRKNNAYYIYNDCIGLHTPGGVREWARGLINCFPVPTKRKACRSYPEAFWLEISFELLFRPILIRVMNDIPKDKPIICLELVPAHNTQMKTLCPSGYNFIKEWMKSNKVKE